MKTFSSKKLSLPFIKFFLLFLFLALSTGVLKAEGMNKATSCSYKICTVNGSGTPLANHKYTIRDGHGNVVATGITDSSGCTTVTLNDGQTYQYCDDTTPCLSNCVNFTVNCLSVGTTLTICSP